MKTSLQICGPQPSLTRRSTIQPNRKNDRSSRPRLSRMLAALLILGMASVETTHAAPIVVSQIGDHGWFSLDTRDSSGNNLVSPTNDAQIQQVIKLTPPLSEVPQRP